jgi:hypothetical protein
MSKSQSLTALVSELKALIEAQPAEADGIDLQQYKMTAQMTVDQLSNQVAALEKLLQ